MDIPHDLREYYYRKVSYLLTQGDDFAARYLEAACWLEAGSDATDPHIGNVIESAALLMGRLHRELGRDLQAAAAATLGALCPNLTRPAPAQATVSGLKFCQRYYTDSGVTAAVTHSSGDRTDIRELRSVAVSKGSDQKLLTACRTPAATKTHIHVLGHPNYFAILAGCGYAVSFDAHGYCDDSSAMVNVLREDCLLFSNTDGQSGEVGRLGGVVNANLREEQKHVFRLPRTTSLHVHDNIRCHRDKLGAIFSAHRGGIQLGVRTRGSAQSQLGKIWP
jgi:hypothetical protein